MTRLEMTTVTESVDPMADFLARPVWAVVGASNNAAKYGNRIFLALRRAGYTVYPVNPNVDEVAGDRSYPSLTSLPRLPDVVDTVVPPAVTERIVAEAAGLGIKRIWMQPGSESSEAIRAAEEAGMTVIHGACAMLGARQGPGPAEHTCTCQDNR
jgi:uncharacterized protein